MWRIRRKLLKDGRFPELAAYCLILQMVLCVYIIPNLFINRQNLDLMYHLVGLSVAVAGLARIRLLEETGPQAGLDFALSQQMVTA